jgi:hypothetical protein
MAVESELPPRLRFAKAEIAKALRALELADSSQVDAWMRVLALEDQLADQREETREWRNRYEALRRMLAAGGTSG